MARRTKILLGIGLAVLLPLALLALTLLASFAGFAELPERAQFGEIHLVKDGFVMAAIVPTGPKEVALIDAGLDPAAAAIKSELGRMALGPEAVKTILLTHGHADHVSGALAFPQATLYAMAEDIPLVEGRAKSQGPISLFLPATPAGLTVRQTLHDGETLVLGAAKLPVGVFALPGHTAGSAAFLVDGLLVLGDAAHHTTDGEFYGASWIFSESLQQNHQALKQLVSRLEAGSGQTVGAVFCAHSGLLKKGLAPLAHFAKGATN